VTTYQQPAGAAFWSGTIGDFWVKRQEGFDAVLAPVGDAAMARAALRPGERAIDVGCGCGTTTFELARRTGPRGHVLGIDISQPMLARARERSEPGQAIEFVEADATTFPFAAASYDVLFSRVGIMFFPDPIAAFTNMRKALRPGGRIALVCFRTPQESPFLMLPLAAAHRHLAPRPPPGPEDPGMFSFASGERVKRILASAGFQSIVLEALDLDLDIAGGRGLEAAVQASIELGPTSGLLLDQPPEMRAVVAASVREALAPYCRDSSVRLRGGFWIVTAGNR
jgi:SAM-dependent methyltransferase